MVDGDEIFFQLLAKWQNMSTGDRNAVERALSVEQRLALEQALLSSDEGEAIDGADAYRGYSGWLVNLLKAQECGDQELPSSSGKLKPKARAAVNDIREGLRIEDGKGRNPTGLFSWIKRSWQDYGALR